MRVIVIGASGFMGGAVAQELLEHGYHVVAVDRHDGGTLHEHSLRAHLEFRQADVTDPSSLGPIFKGADRVYHFAARLGTSELEDDLRACIDTNIVGALNVFEAASKAGVPRVFYASKPSVWLNVYSITKHCGEQIARLMTRYNPVEISVLRYLNIYGPGQKLFHVRKILPIFAAQALRRLPIQVFGDGRQTVDMIYSKDAARLTVDYVEAPYRPDACDCGTGEEITVNDVALAVNHYLGNDAGIHHLPMRKGETPRTRLVANLGPLRSVLKDKVSFTPWPEALATTLDWYAARPAREIDAALASHGIHQRYGVSWT